MNDAITGSEAKPEGSSSPSGWALIASPVLGVALALVAVVLIAFLAAPAHVTVAQYVRTFSANYYAQMATNILIYVAVFLAIWLLLPRRSEASLRSYFPSVSGPTVWLALASGVGFAIVIAVVLTVLAESHAVSFHETPAERALIPHNLPEFALALVAIAIVGPIVEEVYFRGILLRWLRAKMPRAIAAVPNAALFAATHFRFATHIGIEGLVLTAGLFVFGLFAVAWASATKSLWPSIAAHGMYNATLIGAPFLAQQH